MIGRITSKVGNGWLRISYLSMTLKPPFVGAVEWRFPLYYGEEGIKMVTLFVVSFGVLFALLTFSPLLDSEDAGEYLSTEIETMDPLQA